MRSRMTTRTVTADVPCFGRKSYRETVAYAAGEGEPAWLTGTREGSEIAAPMTNAPERSRRRVPPRAPAFSVAALLVPVAGALLCPDSLGSYGPLLWLVALVPAFLLAYYRGWRGVATALAGGMAVLSLTQAAASWLGLG